MATVYGKNKTIVRLADGSKIPAGEVGGEVKIAYDQYTLAAEVAANDIIDMALSIPAGARIVDAAIVAPSMGATGIFQLGTAAVPAALVASADAGGQAVVAKAAGVDVGLKLTATTNYQLKCTEVTAAGTGLVVQAWVAYVML